MNALVVGEMAWVKKFFSSLNWHQMSDVPHWLQSTLAVYTQRAHPMPGLAQLCDALFFTALMALMNVHVSSNPS